MVWRLSAACALIDGAALANGDQTLLGNIGITDNGGCGAPVIRFTRVAGEGHFMFGGAGGWIINQTFVVGGAGWGAVDDLETTYQPSPQEPTLTRTVSFGYGGFFLEYVGLSHQVVHFTISALVGAGGLGFHDPMGVYDRAGDGFFAMEPGAGVELNVVKFFRVNVGGSYRLTKGALFAGVDDADLRGPSAAIAFKFGSF